ncbi:MAG: hypothetical protein O2819_09185 [Planctomycetota bacterium]|nr:hypothetical protein [Planctomycetota bacterium]MDA1106100.1 hypothetical protein [Planctomycetota bacterium]
MLKRLILAVFISLGCANAALAGPVWEEGSKDAGEVVATARTVSGGAGGSATKINGSTSTALMGTPDLIDLLQFKFDPSVFSGAPWSIDCRPGWDVYLFLFLDLGDGVVHLIAAADDISATEDGARISSTDVTLNSQFSNSRYFLAITGKGAQPGYLNVTTGAFLKCFSSLPTDWNGVLFPQNPRFSNWIGTASSAGSYSNNVTGIQIILSDTCADAAYLNDGQNLLDNTAATTDSLSYDMSCSFGGDAGMGKDVWFIYDPVCAGSATVETCGFINFDSVIVVYEVEGDGACPVSSTPHACNDDGSGCSGYSSTVTFTVDPCHRYFVRVGGYCGSPDTNGLCTSASSGFGSVKLTPPECNPLCLPSSDLNADGIVDGADLTLLLTTWGTNGALGQ